MRIWILAAMTIFALVCSVFAQGQTMPDLEYEQFRLLSFEKSLDTDLPCQRMLGLDRNNCTDYESCQKACYSSTSFCLQIALESGKPFINDVSDYQNRSRKLNASIQSAKIAYRKLSDSMTQENMLAYINSFQSVEFSENEFSSHKFLGWLCNNSLHDRKGLKNAIARLDKVNVSQLPKNGEKLNGSEELKNAIKNFSDEVMGAGGTNGTGLIEGFGTRFLFCIGAALVIGIVVLFVVFKKKPAVLPPKEKLAEKEEKKK